MFSIPNRPLAGLRAPLATVLSSARCDSFDSLWIWIPHSNDFTPHRLENNVARCLGATQQQWCISGRKEHPSHIFRIWFRSFITHILKQHISSVTRAAAFRFLISVPFSCVLPSRWSPTAAAVINTPLVYSSPPSWNECHFSSVSVLPFTDPWTNGGF